MEELEYILNGVGLNHSQIQLIKKNATAAKKIDTAGKINFSGSRAQTILDLRIKQYADAGIITSSSFLRAEIPLTTAQNGLQFNFLQSGNSQNANNAQLINTQSLLGQNDTFTVMGMTAYVKTADVTAPALVPTPEQHAAALCHTFPNPQIFTTAGEAGSLNAFIHNGQMLIKLDTTDFMPMFPMQAFYRVGQSQAGVGAATGVIPVQADEWPMSMFGKVEPPPSFEFSGQTALKVSVDLLASMNMSSGVATRMNYAVLEFTGFLHSGANTEYQNRQKLAQQLKNK